LKGFTVVVTKLFNRRWWWKTILVILGVLLLIRLGFWQLDRLDQRRAFNARVAERWQEAPFDIAAEGLPADISELEYRRVEATGQFDYDHQILLKERPRDGAPGVIAVTPLVMDDGRAVLVARGWVPYKLSAPEHWSEFEEGPTGDVVGLIQETQVSPSGEAPPVPDEPQTEWFLLNIDAIQPQMPYELMPVFILQLPEEGRSRTEVPIRDEPLALDEGNHFSYAIQWFMFSAILGIGYLVLIHQQETRGQRLASADRESESETTLDVDGMGRDNQSEFEPDRYPRAPDVPTQHGHA
jgi:surfeit locus 1 family protein